MKTRVIDANSAGALSTVTETLETGGLVAFPTDTVYGLAALTTDRQAIERIYEVKHRNTSRPIALLISDSDKVSKVAILPDEAIPLVRRFWPGGLTLVLPKSGELLDIISPGPTIGVRVPNHSLARDVIRAAGGELAVTSANLSDGPVAMSAEEVLSQLDGRIEIILDGGSCPGGVPSTVLNCTVWPPQVLREGAIPESAITATLNRAGFASQHFQNT